MSLVYCFKTDAFKASAVPLLLIIALFISLNNTGSNYLTLEIVCLVLSLISVISYFYGRYTKTTLLPRNHCVFFWLAFIAWAGFSTLWSAAQAPSLLALMPFIGGLFALTVAYTYSTEQAKTQMQLLLTLAIYLSIYTIYQAVILKINRPAGLLEDWNTHAAFLTMVLLPLCSQFLIHQKQQRNSLLMGICCSLLCIAISLTLSRGAFISLLIGITLISILAFRHKVLAASLLKLYAVIIIGFLLGEWLNQHESFTTHAIASADNLEKLGSGRHLQWKPAWQMYLDRPFLGWGLNTYHLLYNQYKAPLTEEAGNFAHNDYLQFLLELGPIGLSLFSGFVTSLIVYAVKMLKQKTDGEFSATHFYSFSLLAASLGMLAHTAVNFNLYQLPIQMLLGLYVGRTLNYLYADQPPFIPSNVMTAKRYYSILAGFSVPALLLLGSLILALNNVKNAQTATNQIDKLDYAWKAQLFLPFLDLFDYQKTRQLTNLLKTTELHPADKQQISEMAQDLIDTAIYKYTLNPLNYVAKAELLQATDSQNIHNVQIKRNYELALTLAPQAFKIRDNYATYLQEHQQGEQALALLWGAWGRFNANAYQNGIALLTHQLQLNQQFGKQEDNLKIEQEINKLMAKNKIKNGGEFVFGKNNE